MSKFVDEFRDPELAKKLVSMLSSYKGRPVNLMEVCGTHTMSISRYGIRGLLPENINLISGPGCPVCVTPVSYIDSAILLSREKDVIITTFGDLMRVPGKTSSLLKEKGAGRDIRILYSPLDSLKIARDNRDKKVVFLSVGFETTTPIAALTVLRAVDENIKNFCVLSANKTMPEALKILASDRELKIDGFLYPGHVSAVIGIKDYEKLAVSLGIPGVVAGFEPLDILHSILRLVSNINEGKAVVENLYTRVVTHQGNPIAVQKINSVFEGCSSVWRGLGVIPGSGLKMRDEYKDFDAWRLFDLDSSNEEEPEGCMCGEVLKGKVKPLACKLFGKACVPQNPVGACMVSSEGTCAAYYKYGQL
jgi:hydrogenase expression/formation protein HypD